MIDDSERSAFLRMLFITGTVMATIMYFSFTYVMNNIVSASTNDLETLTKYSKQLNSEEFNKAVAQAFDDGSIKAGEYRDLQTLYEKIKKEQAMKELEKEVKPVN
ncbi:MAG: hypothetical protein ACRC2I_11135 [Plesiomonas shigelloides]